MKLYRFLPLAFLALACSLFAPSEPPLTIETLRAQATTSPFATRVPTIPFATLAYPTFSTALASPTDPVPGAPTPTVVPADAPPGKIVFTCQVGDAADFLCLINADGTGFVQLTTEKVKRWYPSLAPDGRSVVYSAYVKNNIYEIYEMALATGRVTQLTDELGILKAPEISPDGKWIAFNRGTPDGKEQLWIMERDGNSAHKLYDRGWDPTWSPDGTQILFASDKGGSNQLYVINRDGSDLRRLTNFS
ncbi:MAG: hypothetical protein AB1750_19265, partial [Chloroflexota bacterium]